MRTRLATLVAILLMGAGAARAKEGDVSVGTTRRVGQRADVYDASHAKLPGHTLVKIPKPGIFVHGQFHYRSDALMKEHAARVTGAIGALTGDAKSGGWFKKIL